MNASVTISSDRVLDLLTALVDASLVVYEEQPDGTGRYRLLETTRQYAEEKLKEAGEEAAVRERHQAFFTTLAEEAEPLLKGTAQGDCLDRLETEHDNFRVALSWRQQDPHETDVCLRLAGSLWMFWNTRGYLSEGRVSLRSVLSRKGATTCSPERAKALEGAGNLAYFQSDYAESLSLLEESLTIRREIGDRCGEARLLRDLAPLMDNEKGMRLCQESLAIFRDLGDKVGIAESLSALGTAVCARGDIETGKQLCEESLDEFRELGDRAHIAETLHVLAKMARFQGDDEAALTFYEQSLAVFRELGHKPGIALSLRHLAIAAEYRENYPLAQLLYEEAHLLWKELGSKHQVAWVTHGMGFIAFRLNDYSASFALLKDALTVFREIGHNDGRIWSLERLAALAMAQGQMMRAGRLLAAAENVRIAKGIPLPRPAHSEHNRNIDAIRGVLGGDAFATVWEEGNKMTLEQAVAYALQETGGE